MFHWSYSWIQITYYDWGRIKRVQSILCTRFMLTYDGVSDVNLRKLENIILNVGK